MTASVHQFPAKPPVSREQEDQHVGEVNFYRRPDGSYYFLNAALDSRAEEVDLYRAMRAGACLQGQYLAKSAPADVVATEDQGLAFGVFAHHSGHVHAFLSSSFEPTFDADWEWVRRRLEEAEDLILRIRAGEGQT